MDYVTKEDLQAALAPFATRDEMRDEMRVEMRAEIRAALAPYPTREEMRAEIRAALTPYPTREEMHAAFASVPTRDEMYAALRMTRDEMFQVMREEGDRIRLHAEVMNESLHDDIRLLAEGQVALHQRIDDVRAEAEGGHRRT